jgi:hypothetical protein
MDDDSLTEILLGRHLNIAERERGESGHMRPCHFPCGGPQTKSDEARRVAVPRISGAGMSWLPQSQLLTCTTPPPGVPTSKPPAQDDPLDTE